MFKSSDKLKSRDVSQKTQYHINSKNQAYMGLEPEDMVSQSESITQDLSCWHLSSSQQIPPHLQTTAHEPALKMKLTRRPVTTQTTSSQQESLQEPIKLIISRRQLGDGQGADEPQKKLRISSHDLASRMPTIEDARLKIVPSKKTPWYMLPRKPACEPEPQKPTFMESTYKLPASKQRVANKPKLQFWNSPLEISKKLAVKLENCKQRLAYPSMPQPPTFEHIKSQRSLTKQTTDKYLITNQPVEQPENTMVCNPNFEHAASSDLNNQHDELTMAFVAAKEARKRAQLLFDNGDIQKIFKQKSKGFKRPTSAKRLPAKRFVMNSYVGRTETSLDSNKPNSERQFDFTAAKEARKKAAQLIKSGGLLPMSKQTGEDSKQPTSSKYSDTFEGPLSAKNVSFSSLCENFQGTTEPWSYCEKNIRASLSSGADTKTSSEIHVQGLKNTDSNTQEPKDQESKKTTEVNLSNTIFVSCKELSKAFLLNSLTKFGTITTILLDSQDDAFVVFHGLGAAKRACVDMNGVATPNGVTMEVRMAVETDRPMISRLKCTAKAPRIELKKMPEAAAPQRQSVWSEIAAVKEANLGHEDSRKLVIYSAYDMFN